jgi:hypothetical protein
MKKIGIFSAFVFLISCRIGVEKTSTNVDLVTPNNQISSDQSMPITVQITTDTDSTKTLALNSQNQETFTFYTSFLKDELLNVEQMVNSKDNQEDVVKYLGILIDLNEIYQYHLITNFTTIQLADGRKGKSRLVFINDELSEIKIYEFNARNELPIKIENNTLIFNTAGIKKGIQLKGGLPIMLCVPDGGCYE